MRCPKILDLTLSVFEGSPKLKKFAGMRKSNEEPLSAVISKLLHDYHLEEGLLEIRIQEAWNQLMDPAIVQRTSAVIFEKGKLTIRTSSSVLAQELSYQLEDIRNTLNAILKADIIQRVEIR